MNTIFKSETSTPMSILHASSHHLELFRKDNTQKFIPLPRRKKNTQEAAHLRLDQHNQTQKNYQIQNNSEKSLKFTLRRNCAEMIDKILLKNALLNLKFSNMQPNINTSIEQNDYFLSSLQNINKKQHHYKMYTPLFSQNEQQHRENLIKAQKYRQKLNLTKIKFVKRTNDGYSLSKSNSQKYFAKIKYDQLKLQSQNITPSDNEWQNSMNLIRKEKRQNEKTKKYCRIMIRKINTDQLLTKRKESEVKVKPRNPCNLKALKLTKPIRNAMSEPSYMKTPQTINPAEQKLFCEIQNLELNPWSTTEIKLKEEIGPMHQN